MNEAVKLKARNLLPIVAGAAVLALLVWAFLPSPVEVDLGRAERGRLQVTVDHEGKTRVRERYIVSSPLAGRLLRITLHPGDAIERGKTLLAIVEPSVPQLLDAREIAQTEARVKAAETAKEQSGPHLQAARVAYDLAETNLSRIHKLAQRQAVSQSEIDTAEHNLRAAAEDVKAAQFAVRIAEFELELARAALVRARPGSNQAPETWRFEIRSPVDGRVLRVFQESEAAIPSGTRLLEVGDPTDLEVEVDVLSDDAVKIEPGARAILEHWGGDEPLTGRVRLVEPSAFTKVSALGVEEQRVNVVIDILDAPERRKSLGDAFRVEARIIIRETENVLKIPAGALFRHADGWAVFVAERGKARLRRVKLGLNNGLEAEVTEGLEEKDAVILHPSDRIKESVAVRSG